MLARSVCELTGEATVAGAWGKLFRHFNRARGKGDTGYKAGEPVAIKPNWVGILDFETRFPNELERAMEQAAAGH